MMTAAPWPKEEEEEEEEEGKEEGRGGEDDDDDNHPMQKDVVLAHICGSTFSLWIFH